METAPQTPERVTAEHSVIYEAEAGGGTGTCGVGCVHSSPPALSDVT